MLRTWLRSLRQRYLSRDDPASPAILGCCRHKVWYVNARSVTLRVGKSRVEYYPHSLTAIVYPDVGTSPDEQAVRSHLARLGLEPSQIVVVS